MLASVEADAVGWGLGPLAAPSFERETGAIRNYRMRISPRITEDSALLQARSELAGRSVSTSARAEIRVPIISKRRKRLPLDFDSFDWWIRDDAH
jgi:hypothetical protein